MTQVTPSGSNCISTVPPISAARPRWIIREPKLLRCGGSTRGPPLSLHCSSIVPSTSMSHCSQTCPSGTLSAPYLVVFVEAEHQSDAGFRIDKQVGTGKRHLTHFTYERVNRSHAQGAQVGAAPIVISEEFVSRGDSVQPALECRSRLRTAVFGERLAADALHDGQGVLYPVIELIDHQFATIGFNFALAEGVIDLR